jgi:hypothetical protein
MRGDVPAQRGLSTGRAVRRGRPAPQIGGLGREQHRRGSKRKSPKDKARIINVSQSEGAEVMSLLDVVDRLKYGRKGSALPFIEKYDQLEGMIENLCQRILEENDTDD